MQAWRWSGSGFEPASGVPLEDRGFRYGMSLFESIRVRAGKPLFLEPHLGRLRRACAERGFGLGPEAITEAGAFLRSIGADGLARIYATAGPGSVTGAVSECGVYLLFEQRPVASGKKYALVFGREPYHALFGGLKTGNYWANVQQIEQAAQRGADEALLFNQQAELVSASMANVFLVHGSRIRTPALACGARDGVIREWVRRQMVVEEGSLFVDDLKTADEIFLTNSWIGIVAAGSMEGHPLPSSVIAADLAKRYEAEIS